MARKNTVLVVDDNETNLELIKATLLPKKLNVDLIIDSSNVEKYMEANFPDLILLDIMMPKLSGFDVCKNLKQNEKTKNIPVIFLTALSAAEDIAKAFECGAVDYIKKPFRKFELIARVQTHLKIVNTEFSLKKELELRRITERNLQKSKSFNQLTQKAKHMGHWEWNLKTDRFDFSEQTGKIFGINRQDPISFRTLLKQVHPKDRKRLTFETVGAIQNKMKLSSSEFRITKYNQIHTILQISEIITDEAQGCVKIIGICEDITKNKQRKTEIQREKEKTQNIIQNISDVYLRVNGSGKIESAGSSALEFLGYKSIGEITGQSLNKLYKTDNGGYRFIRFMKKKQRIRNHLSTLCKPDGTEVSVSLSAKILLDDNGKYNGLDIIVKKVPQTDKRNFWNLKALSIT
ncbi:MAG: response regulator [Bacteroidota bacterium]|nr:response regulator [Bacteroidota bacterium]